MAVDPDPFFVTFRDRDSGRGVPLITLELANGIRSVTDSAGTAAFSDPAFLGREVFVAVSGPGYRYPEQHGGRPGLILTPLAGARMELFVERIQPAERLYRITGQGIYRDSLAAGLTAPIRKPQWNAGVVGQDSAIALPYRGRIIWFWGDTLGAAADNLHVTGAVSALPGPYSNPAAAGATMPAAEVGSPAVGIDLDYFEDERGFVKPLCPFPGPGRIWLDWVVALTDPNGGEQLLARYSRVIGLDQVAEQGFALFDDAACEFRRLRHWPAPPGASHRVDHPLLVTAGTRRYFLFTARFGFRRVPADLGSLLDSECRESFGPVFESASADGGAPSAGPSGGTLHRWRKGVPAADFDHQQQLIAAGRLSPDQAWLRPTDFETGKPIAIYPGSIAWNAWLRRWVLIAQGNLGEVWFGCADSPVGPWVYCRKIADHDRYTFYNPVHHPFFDQDGGRTIFFEGTFTNWFTDSVPKVPRYDYNQILYRLNLERSELVLPVPVYRRRCRGGKASACRTLTEPAPADRAEPIEGIAFFALPANRPGAGLVPVYAHPDGLRPGTSEAPQPPSAPRHPPLFWALPADPPGLDQAVTGPWRCEAHTDDGRRLPFSFRLDAASRTPRLSFEEPFLKAVKVTVSNRRLRLDLDFFGGRYRLEADLNSRGMHGRWRSEETGEAGTWDGVRVDLIGLQLRSPALVPLFEYRFSDSRPPIYSTHPDLAAAGARRSERPLCRVWRNPLPRFLPDLELRPAASNQDPDQADSS